MTGDILSATADHRYSCYQVHPTDLLLLWSTVVTVHPRLGVVRYCTPLVGSKAYPHFFFSRETPYRYVDRRANADRSVHVCKYAILSYSSIDSECAGNRLSAGFRPTRYTGAHSSPLAKSGEGTPGTRKGHKGTGETGAKQTGRKGEGNKM